MSRANEMLMDQLHLITAETLTEIIKKGVPVVDSEGNQTGTFLPCSAPYIAAAIKFLKDNGITAEPDSPRLAAAKKALEDIPTFDADEFDDDDRPTIN